MTHFPPLRNGTSAEKYVLEKSLSHLYFSWPDITIDKLKLKGKVREKLVQILKR